ncbi:MAG TPA: general secretion pathway protein GspB [Methylomirabilota bacterium]
MSYILLALKRSQVDRDVEPAVVRGAARSSSASARRFLWPWLVGGGLAINALVIGAVFMATRQPALDVTEPSPPPAPVATAETPKAVEEVKPPTAPAPVSPAPADSAAKAPTPAAPTSTVPAATMPAEAKPAPTNGTLKAPTASAPRPDAALALVQPPAPVRPPAPSPAQPSAPASAIVPRPAPPDVPVEPSSRHRRRRAHRGVPNEGAQPVPMQPAPAPGAEMELKIEVLVWASDPKQRMVYMNGLKYVEGQRLENGAILEQIVEDGIVVVQNGRRVRVRSDSR